MHGESIVTIPDRNAKAINTAISPTSFQGPLSPRVPARVGTHRSSGQKVRRNGHESVTGR
jgi:hypothetical protein